MSTNCLQRRSVTVEQPTNQTEPPQPIPRGFISQYRHRKPLKLGRMDIECPDCGALHWMAEKTYKSPKSAPRFSKCCKEGAVMLPAIKDPPDDLKELLTSQDHDAVEFRKNIRCYNSALAFTSVDYKVDSRVSGGIVPFQIQGQLCHLHGPLEPNTGQTPAGAQVWFHDPEMGNQIRMNRANRNRNGDARINGSTLGRLTHMLYQCNPFIGIYTTAREQLLALERRLTPVQVLFTPEMRLVMDYGADRRRENLPTSSEVAAIIPDLGPGWHKTTFRDMSLTLRSANPGQLGLRRVDPSHAAYLPLQYVLLFPHGDTGWHWGLRRRARERQEGQEGDTGGHQDYPDPNPDAEGPGDTGSHQDYPDPDPEAEGLLGLEGGVEEIDPDDAGVAEDEESRRTGRVTMRNFHAYRLFPRRSDFNIILRGYRLFQQYVVDAWANIDQAVLKWIFHNQSDIRADLYSGSGDTAAISDATSDQVGKRIILPSSYIGSDRFMQAIFQDSMAIVGHYGRPSLFITFTANPKWAEIEAELDRGQTASDRPDLVARVFQLKLKMLLEELFKDGIFGHAVARVWCIEYQKRGLPHMHLFLEDRNFYLQPETIDQIISAEIPPADWNDDPELAEIVKKVMIHNPCGEHDPKAPCMVKDEKTGRSHCSKKFPKAFSDVTVVQESGYPDYRRRDDGTTAFTRMVNGKEVRIDNRWVVPYSPYLTSRYKAHINVEICASIHAIKYISKYIYKGPDRTTLRLDSNDDEVNLYLQCRYCGPTEACWRIFEFRVHEEYPNVVRLPVYLPGQHSYGFKRTATIEERLAARDNARSKLMPSLTGIVTCRPMLPAGAIPRCQETVFG